MCFKPGQRVRSDTSCAMSDMAVRKIKLGQGLPASSLDDVGVAEPFRRLAVMEFSKFAKLPKSFSVPVMAQLEAQIMMDMQ